jgi:hypothetical protein
MTSFVSTKQLAQMGIPPNRANAQIVAPLSSRQHVENALSALNLSSTSDIPQEWDWRKKTNLEAIQNQSSCGNCWAMSSTAALTDRFRILKNRDDITLNPLSITACEIGQSQGCNGGFPSDAGAYFETQGASQVSSTCKGWDQVIEPGSNCTVLKSINLPPCSALNAPNCDHNFKAVKGSTRSLAIAGDPDQTVHNIKLDIMQYGPVVGAFFVAKDFVYGTGNAGSDVKYRWNATNGIYINGSYNEDISKYEGDDDYSQIINEGGGPAAHAVEIVGWGYGNAGSKYGNVSYWIIKNTWCNEWNDNGYFYFATYPLNKACGMDVPIDMGNGVLFGSCTSFLADPNSGPPPKPGPPPTPTDLTGSGGHRTGMIILWVGVGIVSFAIVVMLLLWLTKKRHKR